MNTRRPRTRRSGRLPTLVALALVALVGCDSAQPSISPTSLGPRPGILIDETWTAANGEWTFTGRVEPEGDPTDVVLEVGPGPATARRFDTRLPVAEDLTEEGPLTITTREIPDIDEVCVRFTATNSLGTSSSKPVCFSRE